jgi:flagellar basal-body rod protein FlgF
MESGIYAACSALMARSQALDILANNLANVSTTGYKGETQFYEALTAAAGGQPLGALNTDVNRFGVLAGQALNLSTGTIKATNNPLDVALEGPGFLEVKTKGGYLYTRAGNLQVGANGQLQTAEGDAVMGIDAKKKTVPITLPSGPVAIASDGTISVGGALVAKLKLVNFPPATPLKPIGDAYFSAPAAAGKAAAGTSVLQGHLESSNVNPVEAETSLISLQRNFDLIERALKIFNTDFDQPAATQLPQVS